MSEQKHTPGPWHASPGHHETNTYLRNNGLDLVATVPSNANARRIVACVNACEGLSTEQLERFPLDSFKECAQAGIASTLRELELEQQRDELLAVLEALHACHRAFSSADNWTALDDDARAAAEAAIANCKP